MRPLSSLGIGLTVVSALLLLALMAELYYLFLQKRRRRASPAVSDAVSSASSSRELLHLFCFKKPAPAAASLIAPQIRACQAAAEHDDGDGDGDDTVEAHLMRLGALAGPPRLLFTIKEETREDLESDDGRSRGRSLGDLMHCSDTPFLTPLSSPPVMGASPASLDAYRQLGVNPLFEAATAAPAGTPSPPPKFQFLKDAEEKLYRRALMEEALRAQRGRSPPSAARGGAAGEEDGAYIAVVIGKNRERGQHHLGSSQVIPLPSPPASRSPVGDSKE